MSSAGCPQLRRNEEPSLSRPLGERAMLHPSCPSPPGLLAARVRIGTPFSPWCNAGARKVLVLRRGELRQLVPTNWYAAPGTGSPSPRPGTGTLLLALASVPPPASRAVDEGPGFDSAAKVRRSDLRPDRPWRQTSHPVRAAVAPAEASAGGRTSSKSMRPSTLRRLRQRRVGAARHASA